MPAKSNSSRFAPFIKWRRLLAIALFFGMTAGSWADVVFLSDGRILIGALVGPVENGVSYRAFGVETTVPIDMIKRTEKSLESLSGMVLLVHLKDGARFQGAIADYDEEIGLFVDIGFGVLTVPVSAIAEIVEMAARGRYSGSPYQLKVGGGFYAPILDAAESFGPDWTCSAGGTAALPFLRGLYGGLCASVSGADYLESDSVAYLLAAIEPEVEFRFMGWRPSAGILGRITPFAALRGGITYIALRDPESYPERSGSMSGSFGLSVGSDFAVAGAFGIRLDGTVSLVMQKTAPFVACGLRLFATYDL